jgi:hypothetical protein
MERCSHSPRMPTTGACKIPGHVRKSFCLRQLHTP